MLDTVTYRLFPISKNKIMVRFINLADLLDANITAGQLNYTYYLNLEQFSEDLYLDENQIKPESIEIQEMSLQGVYPLDEKTKIWRTKDDKSATKLTALVQDKDD